MLSPEKEAAYILKISDLTAKNSSLEEKAANLRQQLTILKKALYRQISEKIQAIMEDAEQLTIFNEAEEAAEKNHRKK